MTQRQMILRHLKSGRGLTALEALQRFGCMRLAARIEELRDEGVRIDTVDVKTTTGKTVAEYRLAPPRVPAGGVQLELGGLSA